MSLQSDQSETLLSVILEMLICHSFKASGSIFSCLNQKLLKSFKEATISLRHLGKSILGENLYLGPLEIIFRVGSHVVFAWIHCTDVRIHCTDILIECR